MIDLQYHKGQKCVYGSTFCQEGYCFECAICSALSPEKYLSENAGSHQFVTKVMDREPVGIGSK